MAIKSPFSLNLNSRGENNPRVHHPPQIVYSYEHAGFSLFFHFRCLLIRGHTTTVSQNQRKYMEKVLEGYFLDKR